jgi:NTE family protein
VAASAAFPGLLTPITLRNFEKDREYQTPAWIDEELTRPDVDRQRYRLALEAQSYIEPGRSYVHLSDGGVSDNLGILPVIQLLEGTIPNDSLQTMLSKGTIKKVVIITVNAKRREKNSWDTQANSLNVLKVLGVASSVPLGNFSEAQVAYLRLCLKELEEKQRLRRQLSDTLGPETVASKFPDLQGPDVDFRFVEIEFNRIEDEAERDYLNAIPTAFRLKREQVDHLRRAAGTIIDTHPAFRALLQELR